MRAGECLFFAAVREDDRNTSGGCFSRLRHGATTSAVNHGHVAADEIGRQRQQKIALLAAPAVIDLDVLSFDIAGFAKALAKCCQRARLRGGSAPGEKANNRHSRPRRPRPKRPRRRRAAECSQQVPPSDGDCHTPLPCEVREGNDTTPQACSLHVQGGAGCWLLPPTSAARVQKR